MTIQNLLYNETHRLDLELSPAQFQVLEAYVRLLCRWGRKINLTGKPEAEAIVRRQLPDTLVLYRQLLQNPPSGPRYLDVGSGGGLPGLALAMLMPQLQSTMVECNHKKCAFMRTVCAELQRPDIVICPSRLEQMLPVEAELVSSRATWEPLEWLKRGSTMVEIGGHVVTFSNQRFPQDTDFGSMVREHVVEYQLDDGTTRIQGLFRKP